MLVKIPRYRGRLFIGLLSVLGPAVSSVKSAARPNIVLILADDLGMGDLGCYGATDIASPQIDRIAAEGMRFDRNYAYPVCTPSRASIMTGRLAENLGITSALMGDGGLEPHTPTVAQRLRATGYRTGLIGKWHLGYSPDRGPNQLGFERFFGFRGGKIDYFLHRDSAQRDESGSPLGKHDLWSDEVEVHHDGEYATELFTKEAVEFILRNDSDERPFFLVLAYNAPHYARPGVLQAPAEYIARFAVDPTQPTPRETYRAMVACMDDGVGEVRAALRQVGADENTLLIFASDNGADSNSGGSNGTFRGGKWTVYEGGIRVPMVARWPGHIPAGTRSEAVLHCADLAPTLLRAAGVGEVHDGDFDGVDALSAWLDPAVATPSRRLSFAFRGLQAVIDGPWKQISPADAEARGESMLYDLARDPGESADVSAEHPEIAAALSKQAQPNTSIQH